jgi:hypothetical protein
MREGGREGGRERGGCRGTFGTGVPSTFGYIPNDVALARIIPSSRVNVSRSANLRASPPIVLARLTAFSVTTKIFFTLIKDLKYSRHSSKHTCESSMNTTQGKRNAINLDSKCRLQENIAHKIK